MYSVCSGCGRAEWNCTKTYWAASCKHNPLLQQSHFKFLDVKWLVADWNLIQKHEGNYFGFFFISSDAFLSKKCFGRLLQTSGSFGLSRKNKRAHKHLLFCVVILCLLHCYFPCLQSFVLHLWKGLLVTWLSIHMAEKAPPSRTNLTVKIRFLSSPAIQIQS